MKRIAAILLIIAALITGAGCTQGDAKYQYVFFDVFDNLYPALPFNPASPPMFPSHSDQIFGNSTF